MDKANPEGAAPNPLDGLEEHYGEFREEKRWIKVTRETRWRTKNGRTTWEPYEALSIRMVKNKPKDPAWNDLYFPIVIKIPMFYEHQTTTEIEVPPRPAGRVALDLLNPKGER